MAREERIQDNLHAHAQKSAVFSFHAGGEPTYGSAFGSVRAQMTTRVFPL